jgi:hypothetical protein
MIINIYKVPGIYMAVMTSYKNTFTNNANHDNKNLKRDSNGVLLKPTIY